MLPTTLRRSRLSSMPLRRFLASVALCTGSILRDASNLSLCMADTHYSVQKLLWGPKRAC